MSQTATIASAAGEASRPPRPSDAMAARALWFEAARTAGIRDDFAPAPGPRDIRVRALCSLVSAGSEMLMYRGEGNLPDLLLPTITGTLPFPIKFGYQIIAEVEDAGAVSGYVPGDRVFVRHPHQDRFTISTTLGLTEKLPHDVDPLRAAFVGLSAVALQTLLEAPVRPGECVVLSGLGIVGSIIAHLVRKTAGKLILIDPLQQRRDAAQWIGADAVVDPSEAAGIVERLSGGRGADMSIEASGAPAALQTALRLIGQRGTVVVPAWYGSRPVPLTLSPEFHLKALKILSAFIGSVGGDIAARWDEHRRLATALEILGAIDPANLISHRLPFEEAATAYRILDERPAEALGIILEYG